MATSDNTGASADPYNPADKPETSAMTFERQSGNGDRYYTRPVEIDSVVDADRIIGTDQNHIRLVDKQDHFYRAMHRDEYDAWQTVFKQGTPELHAKKYTELKALQIEGHQGWASYRAYSEEYLSEKNGYTHRGACAEFRPGYAQRRLQERQGRIQGQFVGAGSELEQFLRPRREIQQGTEQGLRGGEEDGSAALAGRQERAAAQREGQVAGAVFLLQEHAEHEDGQHPLDAGQADCRHVERAGGGRPWQQEKEMSRGEQYQP
ncbi:hypothetical protein [Burkholderia perseverans]|uniref:hypothetical protein n=1 Tax=Burkholderia perseverans TaxID=2615214 RepID=UPI001FF033B6|nr:hypothetical protein [Burkholderia perseverans]